MTKTCQKCGVEKDSHEFWARKSRAGGLRSACKACETDAYRKWQREHGNAAQRRWRERHPHVARQQYRRKKVKQKYGLSLEEADIIVARGCAICGSTEQICIDHDHATGKVRDALCRRCNLALGHFDDDPARLRIAAEYLESHCPIPSLPPKT